MKNFCKIMLLAMLCFTLLAACSEPPKPEDALKKYTASWQKQDFESMYDMLDSTSKKKITKEDFVNRYKGIYSGIEADDLKVKMKSTKKDKKEEGEKANLSYSVKMDTLAGPIEYTHKITMKLEEDKDQEAWKVAWNTSHIFPDMEEGDRISASTISPKRGAILDREGNPLAFNGTAYEVTIVPEELPEDPNKTIKPLAEILGMTPEEIQSKLDQPWVKPNYGVPIKKMETNDPKVHDAVKLEGVKSPKSETRIYPLKEAAAHLTGYIGPVNADDLKRLEGKGYTLQDWVGKAGLEQVYEEQLRGTPGGIIKILTEDKEEKAVLAEKEVINGEDVKTTINSSVQRSIYAQLKGDVGTSSAIHPKTGEVLALVNSPSYNPNEYTLGISNETRNKLENDPNKPKLNRFIYTYAPGSTLKPLTAAIGLENGTLNPSDVMKVSGKTWKKGESWGDYHVTRVSAVPNVNLEKALIYSDNIYFAQEALDLGQEKFVEGLKGFGLGEKMPVGYPFAASTIGEEGMTEIQLADSGYGQGKIEMSALHLGISYTPFLNEGSLLAPKLDLSKKDQGVWKENVISQETAKIIRDDLTKVVTSKNGTAHEAYMAKLPLAGKTGTAELKKSKEDKKGMELGWFVAYNTEDPSLLVTMMIEDVKGRGGSHYLVPKVKKVFEENFLE
ncbi:penicillin-binding transpeptidase domain-containing protein [Fictibacillus phosphorivorans]|uniref:penicillin-binding transpeptidase domain-containing protein n=1 Tax=Fictibacillus phosphorivorans TaxID=1221500 RepID=UPI00204232CA|nr:penicillin-binding transpeptidase domain-containing protein [Fictibacillus phosphorivorans]MCM3718551.1 penicillin-binding transpeptidase domain-containing protein [Fictibacillus phosphorivorans]MCM3776093.1 penicillin-binding transpeptidase domain-containing protein [Fictibacillus phosphorivorans]